MCQKIPTIIRSTHPAPLGTSVGVRGVLAGDWKAGIVGSEHQPTLRPRVLQPCLFIWFAFYFSVSACSVYTNLAIIQQATPADESSEDRRWLIEISNDLLIFFSGWMKILYLPHSTAPCDTTCGKRTPAREGPTSPPSLLRECGYNSKATTRGQYKWTASMDIVDPYILYENININIDKHIVSPHTPTSSKMPYIWRQTTALLAWTQNALNFPLHFICLRPVHVRKLKVLIHIGLYKLRVTGRVFIVFPFLYIHGIFENGI